LCDGTNTHSRVTYSALFAVIGTTYSAGNGTTFGVPDLRGRTIIGVGQGIGLTNRGLSVKVGAETITLNSSQIPAHSHPNIVYGSNGGNTGGMSGALKHSHSSLIAAGQALGTGASGFANLGGGYFERLIVRGTQEKAGWEVYTSESPSLEHSHTFTPVIENKNNLYGDNPHDNMQPSMALNYIIKT